MTTSELPLKFHSDATLDRRIVLLHVGLWPRVVSVGDPELERDGLRDWRDEIDVTVHAIVTGWSAQIGKYRELLIGAGASEELPRRESEKSADARVTLAAGWHLV